MNLVPASTRAALVVVLALGLVSAVPCSAIRVLLHAAIIDQSITPVKPRGIILPISHAAVAVRSRDVGTSSAGSALCLHTGARRGRGEVSGGAGDQRRGVESAELFVVEECRDGWMRAAERAVGITPDA